MLRGYSRNHEVKPLEESSDLIHNNNYTCSYNGKEVMINIRMMKPDEDYSDED